MSGLFQQIFAMLMAKTKQFDIRLNATSILSVVGNISKYTNVTTVYAMTKILKNVDKHVSDILVLQIGLMSLKGSKNRFIILLFITLMRTPAHRGLEKLMGCMVPARIAAH